MNKDFSVLENDIVACRKCARLNAWRAEVARLKRKAYQDQEYWGKPVPGFGDPDARILIVGLAPGAHGSNRTGRMFSGDASGNFLFSALNRFGFANQAEAFSKDDGLQLSDVFISAVCRCAPPANKPTKDEINSCLPWLWQEVAFLSNLQGIVALGKIAYDGVTRMYKEHDLTLVVNGFSHGEFYLSGEGKPWVLCSYHPSQQNTQTGRLTQEMFDSIWEEVIKDLAMS
ncbi:MAG: uracil-DNA glycosylase [Anaerolineaceae bacterium]|nr:uracil-DNA glycosylase [Anaerolineaceae bacterium]